jgi:transposase-like protein
VPYAKYTRAMLVDAVAASTSMADVLRHLGLALNGGTHAHLRRRITQFGIDTSHFLGRAHARGTSSPRRRDAAAILVVRPAGARRQAPGVLRRALEELGRPYLCAGCGVGNVWNGLPLTLQVDHIDGCFANCRAENLRFLCPNCHTQTSTHAGRNRAKNPVVVVRVDERGNPTLPPAQAALTEEEQISILRQVQDRQMTVADAARALGRSRQGVYSLLRRWSERNSLATRPPRGRARTIDREAVVAFAVSHPALGPRKIAAALRARPFDPIAVSATSVENILREAGLGTRQARSALTGGA